MVAVGLSSSPKLFGISRDVWELPHRFRITQLQSGLEGYCVVGLEKRCFRKNGNKWKNKELRELHL